MKTVKFAIINIVTFLSVLITSTCATLPNSNPASSLVPADAMIYTQIGNMEQFLENSDEFLIATGISEQMKDMTIKSVVKLVFAMTLEGLSLDWFDLEKPVAFALLPQKSGLKEEWNNFIFTFPLNSDGNKNFTQLKTIVENKTQWYVKKINNYAVICSQEAVTAALPPVKSLDIRQIEKYNPGSLSIYINFDNLLTALDKTWDDLKNVLNTDNPENKTSYKSEIKESLVLIDWVIKYLKEIQDFSCNMLLDKNGLAVNSDFTFVMNGEIHKFSKQIKEDKKIKEFVKYLPRDAIYSIATALSYEGYDEMFKEYYKILGISEPALNALLKNFQEISTYFGPRSALAYDFAFDFESLSEIDEAKVISNPEIISDAISIDMIAVAEIKDYNKIKEFYKSFQLDTLINRVYQDILKKAEQENLKIQINIDIQQDLVDNGFKYDLFTFDLNLDFSVLDNSDPEVQVLIQTLINQIMQKFKFYVHYTKNRYYMVLGYAGMETLKALAAKDGLESNPAALSSSLLAAGLLSRIPDKSDLIYQFSLVKFINLLAGIPTLKISPLELEDAPGFIGYVDFYKNLCTVGIAWDSGEIAAVWMQLLPVFSSFGEDKGNSDIYYSDEQDSEETSDMR